MWVEEVHLQERVAALSSRGVDYVINGSGHYIQKDRPAAVISAVDEVVDQARHNKIILDARRGSRFARRCRQVCLQIAPYDHSLQNLGA
jgi:hypothetical protein